MQLKGFALLEILPVSHIHHAGVSKFFEVDHLAADFLLVLAIAFLSLNFLPVMVVAGGDIRVKGAGLPYAFGLLDELNLHNLVRHVSDYLKVRYTVGLARLNDVLKYLFGVLLNVQQLDNLLRPLELRRHFRRFLGVLDVTNANAESCDIVLIGAYALGENSAVLYELRQPTHIMARGYPVPGVVCFLLCYLYGRVRLFNEALLRFNHAHLHICPLAFSHSFSPLSSLAVLLVGKEVTRSPPRPGRAARASSPRLCSQS